MMNRRDGLLWLAISSGFLIMVFILLPLLYLLTSTSINDIKITIREIDVLSAIGLSIYTSGCASLISFVFGTPLAYLLARKEFRGKGLVEGIITLPIVIPHPVVGIAILGVAGKNHIIGQFLQAIGIRIMGSITGIIAVLVFVGVPFYINLAKEGFENVPLRLEKVSRSLGITSCKTFLRITLPLASSSMMAGFIMCMARAMSEFGGVIVVAYHPMIAPVMIFDRFETYGLRYSQPIAVFLLIISLALFVSLRSIKR